MMTVREAKQRCAFSRMSLRNTGHGEWRINFVEATDDRTAYFTDDLEDAVLTGASMRRKRNLKLFQLSAS